MSSYKENGFDIDSLIEPVRSNLDTGINSVTVTRAVCEDDTGKILYGNKRVAIEGASYNSDFPYMEQALWKYKIGGKPIPICKKGFRPIFGSCIYDTGAGSYGIRRLNNSYCLYKDNSFVKDLGNKECFIFALQAGGGGGSGGSWEGNGGGGGAGGARILVIDLSRFGWRSAYDAEVRITVGSGGAGGSGNAGGTVPNSSPGGDTILEGNIPTVGWRTLAHVYGGSGTSGNGGGGPGGAGGGSGSGGLGGITYDYVASSGGNGGRGNKGSPGEKGSVCGPYNENVYMANICTQPETTSLRVYKGGRAGSDNGGGGGGGSLFGGGGAGGGSSAGGNGVAGSGGGGGDGKNGLFGSAYSGGSGGDGCLKIYY